MVMGFVLVMIGLFCIDIFLGVCFLFLVLLLVLFTGLVLVRAEEMLRKRRFVFECFFAFCWWFG
jgi:hypothetical protein